MPISNALITGDIDKTYARGSNFDDLTSWGISAVVQWRASDSLAVKSITAYRELDSKFGSEIAAAPILANDASFAMNQEQFSQELQFNFDSFGKRLKSVFGLYYFNESGGLTDTPIFGEGLIQIYGPNDFDNEAYAAFVHEHLDLTDRWGLTFGARYTEEKKEFEGFQRDLNMFFIRARGVDPNGPLPPSIVAILPDPSDPTRLYPLGRNHQEFSDASFKAGTEFKFTEDVMSYYSFSQGFKSGGWTTRLLDVVPGNDADDLTFKPETAETHEIGLKSELFGRRMRVNVAAFSTKYDNMQITVFNGISPVFSNAGKAKIDGVEVEAEAVAGWAVFNAGVGYLDARYTRLDAGATFPISNRLVNAPEWTANAGALLKIPLASGASIDLAGDYSYRTNTSPDAENSPYLESGNIGLWNGSIALTGESDRWDLKFGIHNISDERFIVGGFDQSHPGQVGFVSAAYSPPRQWYLTIRVRS